MMSCRFVVNPSGRRSGKSELAKRCFIERVQMFDKPDGFFVMGAPTRDQAKRIFWSDLKRMVPEEMREGKANETHLTLRLASHVNVERPEISVVGMDRPERIEGAFLDGFLGTEFGNFKEDAWGEHIRPALSTIGRPGFAWIEGTPEGRNHYYDLVMEAQFDPGWSYHQWPSWEILDEEEIAAAKCHLDPLTFRQEYGGEFVEFSGRAYYGFSREGNVDARCIYDPSEPLHFSFDFNVRPGVAVVSQELQLEGADGRPEVERRTCVIGEVFIEDNSNTIKVCGKLLSRYGDHEGPIYVYADASGGARHTSQVAGSDLDLIRSYLRDRHSSVIFRVPKRNPAERARLNAMNSRLESIAGDRRLLVSPTCKRLIDDFEGVSLDLLGQIDKKSNIRLTHLTDALGYMVAERFSVRRSLVTSTVVM
jgi:hypothetical protein